MSNRKYRARKVRTATKDQPHGRTTAAHPAPLARAPRHVHTFKFAADLPLIGLHAESCYCGERRYVKIKG